ncbi:MAG: HD domain-containing protein, partial [Candidatus Omnitrophica bacterium]|nr:HD domain-containing protein [Candidatus Omnitrophota bacterium]
IEALEDIAEGRLPSVTPSMTERIEVLNVLVRIARRNKDVNISKWLIRNFMLYMNRKYGLSLDMSLVKENVYEDIWRGVAKDKSLPLELRLYALGFVTPDYRKKMAPELSRNLLEVRKNILLKELWGDDSIWLNEVSKSYWLATCFVLTGDPDAQIGHLEEGIAEDIMTKVIFDEDQPSLVTGYFQMNRSGSYASIRMKEYGIGVDLFTALAHELGHNIVSSIECFKIYGRLSLQGRAYTEAVSDMYTRIFLELMGWKGAIIDYRNATPQPEYVFKDGTWIIKSAHDGIALVERIHRYLGSSPDRRVSSFEEITAISLEIGRGGLTEGKEFDEFVKGLNTRLGLSDSEKLLPPDFILRPPPLPGKGALTWMTQIATRLFGWTGISNDTIENWIVPLLEEGLIALALLSGHVWLYALVRVLFIIAHIFWANAPPAAGMLGIYYRIAMPTIASGAAVLPLIFGISPITIITSLILGIAVHVWANNYVSNTEKVLNRHIESTLGVYEKATALTDAYEITSALDSKERYVAEIGAIIEAYPHLLELFLRAFSLSSKDILDKHCDAPAEGLLKGYIVDINEDPSETAENIYRWYKENQPGYEISIDVYRVTGMNKNIVVITPATGTGAQPAALEYDILRIIGKADIEFSSGHSHPAGQDPFASGLDYSGGIADVSPISRFLISFDQRDGREYLEPVIRSISADKGIWETRPAYGDDFIRELTELLTNLDVTESYRRSAESKEISLYSAAFKQARLSRGLSDYSQEGTPITVHDRNRLLGAIMESGDNNLQGDVDDTKVEEALQLLRDTGMMGEDEDIGIIVAGDESGVATPDGQLIFRDDKGNITTTNVTRIGENAIISEEYVRTHTPVEIAMAIAHEQAASKERQRHEREGITGWGELQHIEGLKAELKFLRELGKRGIEPLKSLGLATTEIEERDTDKPSYRRLMMDRQQALERAEATFDEGEGRAVDYAQENVKLADFILPNLEEDRMGEIAREILAAIPKEYATVMNEVLGTMHSELKEKFQKDAAAGLLHTLNVVYLAIEIARREGKTEDARFMRNLIAAALLHDIGNYKIGQYDGEKERHQNNSAGIILEGKYVRLSEAGFQVEDIREIAKAIAEHGFIKGVIELERGSREFSNYISEILNDADSLSNASLHGIEKRLERIRGDIENGRYLFFDTEIELEERIARITDPDIRGKRIDGMITFLRSVVTYGMILDNYYTEGARGLILEGGFVEASIQRIREIIFTTEYLDNTARGSAGKVFDEVIEGFRSSNLVDGLLKRLPNKLSREEKLELLIDYMAAADAVLVPLTVQFMTYAKNIAKGGSDKEDLDWTSPAYVRERLREVKAETPITTAVENTPVAPHLNPNLLGSMIKELSIGALGEDSLNIEADTICEQMGAMEHFGRQALAMVEEVRQKAQGILHSENVTRLAKSKTYYIEEGFYDQLNPKDKGLIQQILKGHLGDQDELDKFIGDSEGRAYIAAREVGEEKEGRTIYLDLEKPVEVGAEGRRVLIRSLRFKGVRPRIVDGKVPPYTGQGYARLGITAEGDFVEVRRGNTPKGGLTAERAKLEYEMMKRFRHADYPVGWGRYGLEFEGEQLGLVIAGMR